MVEKFIRFLSSIGVSEESLNKIEQFIETGDESVIPTDLPDINMSMHQTVNFEQRKLLLSVIYDFESGEIKAKRIVSILMGIGGHSFFSCIHGEVYNLNKVVEYLQDSAPGEEMIIWLLSLANNRAEDIISTLNLIFNYDKEVFYKAYERLKDDFQKVLLVIYMLKNDFNLSHEQDKLIKDMCSGKGIKDLSFSKLRLLCIFLYYAHEKKIDFKLLASKILNNHFEEIFNEFVQFNSNTNYGMKAYDLILDLNIQKSYYAVWLVKNYMSRRDTSEILKEIKERVDEIPLAFRKALDLSWVKEDKKDQNSFISFHVAYLIHKFTGSKEDFAVLKTISLNYLGSYLIAVIRRSPQGEVENWQEIWEYLNKQKSIKDIEHRVLRIKEVQDHLYIDYNYKKLFSSVFNVQELREISFRFLNLLIEGQKYGVVTGFISGIIQEGSMSYNEVMQFLMKNGVSAENIIKITDISLVDRYSGYIEGIKEFIQELAKIEGDNLVNNLPGVAASTREAILEGLFNADRKKYTDILIQYMGDSSKGIRNKVAELLSTNEASRDKVFNGLKARKAAARECAASILSSFDMVNYKDELQEILAAEKNEKVKNLIMNILNIEQIKDIEFKDNDDIRNYCLEKLEDSKASLPAWIDIKAMPEVSFNSGEIAGIEVMKYLLIRYASENAVTKNEEAEKIFKHMNKVDLDKFANELLNMWIEKGADTKRKWVLSFAAASGGFNVVNTLKKQIELWPQVSRGTIACEAVKALALLGSNEALIIIDSIARKFKFKQVKKAAGEAFQFAAETLKVDYEELADKIVPALGFNKAGERIVDYGTRKFTVLLERDFSLKISDENGKSYKSLPKPNKSDNEALAKDAQEEFKNLKKQLKNVVTAQNTRLELALSVNRMWTKSSWEKLFVENPIMHNFSLGLIWGVYEEGKLKENFRYMEDGTFNTKDENEFEIPEGAMIGLVHPLELKEADIEVWKTQLEDYEIEQPFLQLLRPVYRLTEEEANMKWVERFGGKIIYGLSLVGKLTKFGWYKGSVQDGGGYYQLYKENKTLGVGAEISFEGLGIGWEDHDTTIYELVFYKEGTVERGSYVYDEVTDANMIVPASVPERFFSEILYDLDRALEASTGLNKKWKKDSYRK